MHTDKEASAALRYLKGFVGMRQLLILADLMLGEEGQHFIDTVCKFADRIKAMPVTGKNRGPNPIAYLHFFKGGYDAYITEKDVIEGEQNQASGSASFGYGFERGYISLIELAENNVELDLYFEPTPLNEIARVMAA